MQKHRPWAGYLLGVVMIMTAIYLPGYAQTVPQESHAGAGSPASADEVSALKQELAAQQKQLEQMQAAMARMKEQLDRADRGSQTAAANPPNNPPSLGQVASLSPVIPHAAEASPPSSLPGATGPPRQKELDTEESPLSVKIGGAEFTPGGFADFTTFFRSTNVGSGIGTSFGGIPYSGTPAGSLSETRFTMQNSRISLGVTSRFEGFDLKAYVEADFLGFAPPNVYVSSNSNTLRSRLYWIQARKGKFEFLGGQSWSLLTPNRTGLSPNPPDIFYSQDMDTNYQVGLTWARQAQFRMVYHASDTVAAGVSIEDPQQFVGTVTVPAALVAEADNGSGSITGSNASNNPATPNLAPDVIAKIAADPMIGGLHEHVEVAGLLTSARIYDPTAHLRNTAVGGGGSVNFNLELVKNLHAIVNTFYSDGGGRYIYGLGPQFIIDRDANGDYQASMLHASSVIGGLEYQVTKGTMFYGYYGGAQFGRAFGIDCYVQPVPPGTTPSTVPVCTSTVSSKPSYIGFGYPGAPSSQNRTLQEATLGVIQTFWKNPHYGALQLITQYSFLDRDPWVVSGPKNAHLSMAYVDLRYVLP